MDKLIDNYTDGWKRIVDFSGKSTREQFWTFYLGNMLIDMIISAIIRNSMFAIGIVAILFFIAGLANLFRRLHDTSRSAWNLLWFLLPVVGWIIILVYLLQPSK